MAKIHTLIISPKYRPYQDGLSDYVYFFMEQLRLSDRVVNLLTSSDNKIKEFAKNRFDIHPIIEHWDGLGPLKLMKFILTKNPEFILLEYVPQMYGRAGVNFLLPPYVFALRFIFRKKIILMAHELHYPFLGDIKSGILFLFHIWNLFLLTISCNKILTTTNNFKKILKRFPFTNNRVEVLPVGPNIKRVALEKHVYNQKNLVLFGSLHPSRNTSSVLGQISNYFKNNPAHPFHLDIVGASENEVMTALELIPTDERDKFLSKITIHGKLNESEVASIFMNAYFSLNYYLDGISGRRGSAIAALNLGLPIISNYKSTSDPVFLNQPMILFSEDDDVKSCLSKIQNINEEDYQQLRLKALQFVDENFSWEKICNLYLSFLPADKPDLAGN